MENGQAREKDGYRETSEESFGLTWMTDECDLNQQSFGHLKWNSYTMIKRKYNWQK